MRRERARRNGGRALGGVLALVVGLLTTGVGTSTGAARAAQATPPSQEISAVRGAEVARRARPAQGTREAQGAQEVQGAQEAQDTQTGLPSPREIIDRYVEAIGGEELVRSFESRRATGTFEVQGQGVGGTVEILSAAPNRLVVDVEYEGVGAARTGFDGEVGWAIDPMTGPRLLSGQELDQLRDEADFYGDLHDPSKYVSVETVAREPFAGSDTWKIRLERPSGRVYFEYFDVETGLLVGNEGEQASMMGTLTVVSEIGGYEEFDGLLMATRVTQDFGMGQQAVTILERVEHGTLTDEDFALPQQIQALVQD